MRLPVSDFAEDLLKEFKRRLNDGLYTIEAYGVANRQMGYREHTMKVEFSNGDYFRLEFTDTRPVTKTFDEKFQKMGSCL